MTIYSITSSIPKKFGGLTTAVLQRTCLLNSYNYDAKVITTDYMDLANIDKVISDKKLFSQDNHINVYDYLADNDKTIRDNYKKVISSYSEQKNIYKTHKNGTSTHYFFNKQGLPTIEVKYKEDKTVNCIHYYSEYGTFIKEKSYVNDYGNIYKNIYYSPEGTRLKQEYINNEGEVYLIEEMDTTKELCAKLDNQWQKFSNKEMMQISVLNRIINPEDIIISDKRSTDNIVFSLSAHRYFACHLRHWSERGKIRPMYQKLFERLENTQGKLLTFTHEQAKDIEEEFPYLQQRIVTIPHYIDLEGELALEKSEPHFVIISRLARSKNIIESIDAFHSVHQMIPHYTLEIYGNGEEEETIKKYIEKNNLTEVHMNGYISNVKEYFYKAAGCLSTSQEEAFGITISESLSQGCPVIAYEIAYGPKDLLEGKADCFLIANHDRDSFEKAIVALANKNDNNEQQRQLLQQQHCSEFSKESIMKQWRNLIEEVKSNE